MRKVEKNLSRNYNVGARHLKASVGLKKMLKCILRITAVRGVNS
jgi:hypothetical protein